MTVPSRPGLSAKTETALREAMERLCTELLDVVLVRPDVVVEVPVDTSVDLSGRWRHPVRIHRVRTDPTPAAVVLVCAS
ncbi:hypothetical protein [Streptomyces sp. NPDC006971]|uniref:hypothetical protein n=1 Tax=Streptomyces sp. NPDC006971 TaxID=3154784 RepID=UPI0033E3B55F